MAFRDAAAEADEEDAAVEGTFFLWLFLIGAAGLIAAAAAPPPPEADDTCTAIIGLGRGVDHQKMSLAGRIGPLFAVGEGNGVLGFVRGKA